VVLDPSIAVAMVKIVEEEMGETVRLWPKLMTCARKTDEKIEGRTEEKIAVKIDGQIGEKTDKPIAKWIDEKIGEKTARWVGGRIDRLIAGRTTDQTLAANSAGLIGPIMLPANVAVTEGTTLVRCR